MKKYIIGGVLAAAFVAYIVFANKNSPAAPVAETPTTAGTGTAPAGNDTMPAGGAVKYKDGTYAGPVADAFYGKLQAVAVIQGGKIVDVQFPQAPSGGHSGEVSAFALPALKQEAIAAQSANVNIVSGATQDSQAFQQSLGAALAQAKS